MCMIDYADERCIVLHEGNPTARKQHTCSECGRTIRVGETYENACLLYDGTKSTSKTCVHCQEVRRWLSRECGGWCYGGVEEDIAEHAHEGYGWPVARMAVGMRTHWTRRDGNLLPLPKQPPTTHEKIQ